MNGSSEPATQGSAAVRAGGDAATTTLQNLLSVLFQKSGAASWNISREEFARILLAVAAKYLPADASEPEAAQFYQSLHVEELALARACAAGHEAAWERFLTRYRAPLFASACSIAKQDAVARELADSLYADLYGVNTCAGERVSKLNFYMGRGSLEGWLRTVLAQEYVNRYRAGKRLVSLDAENEERAAAGLPPVELAAAPSDPPVEVDRRLETAIDHALAALSGEERLILAAYFLDGRRLAEIARMLGVHESTISRKVEKLTRTLREDIAKRLLAAGLSRRQADEALELDVRELSVDIRGRLAQESPADSFLKKGP
jgi:RNA polymerase sigma-70 factor, ECF subfamily